MKDESHLPVSEQSLVFRLRKRAEIRRQIAGRKSVEEGKPDRIADLLEEAANEIEQQKSTIISQENTIKILQEEVDCLKNN
jgi:polyhydroxyalkanoate synthesis regulator phasin